MTRKLFDDDESDDWLKPLQQGPFEWDDEEETTPQSGTTSVKFNPKILIFAAVALIGIIAIGPLLNLVSGISAEENEMQVQPTRSPKVVDLYSQPKSFQKFIDRALASTVTLYCGDALGSGWVIDLSDDSSSTEDDEYPTEIVTNYHVIDQCLDGSAIAVQVSGEEEVFESYLYSYDSENDLAVLITSRDLPSFSTVSPANEPLIGHWVMAIGSPTADTEVLSGSVTTGAITNLRSNAIVTDTAINPGNSGGPLLNAAGQVIAVNTEKIMDIGVDNIGFARKVELLCVQLDSCTLKRILK